MFDLPEHTFDLNLMTVRCGVGCNELYTKQMLGDRQAVQHVSVVKCYQNSHISLCCCRRVLLYS